LNLAENESSRMRPARWLLAVAWDWLLIVATLVAVARLNRPVAYWAGVIVIGTRQHALAVLAHEGAHLLICRPRWLNDLLTHLLCFLPLGASLQAYREFHFEHHRKLGTAEDTEIAAKSRMPGTWDLPRKRGSVVRDLLKDLVGLGVPEAKHVFGVLKPEGIRDALPILIYWTVAVTLLWHAKLLWVIPYWLFASITVHWAVFRLRIWIEHAGTTGTHRIRASWWQRWLLVPHNVWYHYEHHQWPGTSCFDLPSARKLDTLIPVMSLSDLLRSFESYPSQTQASAEQSTD
jgi:fatty acid desaturase